jgi:hypothetical protein
VIEHTSCDPPSAISTELRGALTPLGSITFKAKLRRPRAQIGAYIFRYIAFPEKFRIVQRSESWGMRTKS